MADPPGVRLRNCCKRGVTRTAPGASGVIDSRVQLASSLIGLQCGCELTPYVLLRRPDKTVTTDDVPETAPLDGHFLRYKW
ncbi:hypothetical protein SESBI_37297 [Sesbania bispinosa]|nr:hypothetical protein SESBI_37297 [Sesbania bispinosa]